MDPFIIIIIIFFFENQMDPFIKANGIIKKKRKGMIPFIFLRVKTIIPGLE